MGRRKPKDADALAAKMREREAARRIPKKDRPKPPPRAPRPSPYDDTQLAARSIAQRIKARNRKRAQLARDRAADPTPKRRCKPQPQVHPTLERMAREWLEMRRIHRRLLGPSPAMVRRPVSPV